MLGPGSGPQGRTHGRERRSFPARGRAASQRSKAREDSSSHSCHPPTWCPLREGREAGRPAKPGPREPPPWAGQGGRGAQAQRALREHRGPFRRPRQHPALSEHLHWCPLTLTKINPKRIFTFRKTAESENTVQCFFCSNVREGLPEPPCGRPQVLPQGRRPTLLLRGRHWPYSRSHQLLSNQTGFTAPSREVTDAPRTLRKAGRDTEQPGTRPQRSELCPEHPGVTATSSVHHEQDAP